MTTSSRNQSYTYENNQSSCGDYTFICTGGWLKPTRRVQKRVKIAWEVNFRWKVWQISPITISTFQCFLYPPSTLRKHPFCDTWQSWATTSVLAHRGCLQKGVEGVKFSRFLITKIRGVDPGFTGSTVLLKICKLTGSEKLVGPTWHVSSVKKGLNSLGRANRPGGGGALVAHLQ